MYINMYRREEEEEEENRYSERFQWNVNHFECFLSLKTEMSTR